MRHGIVTEDEAIRSDHTTEVSRGRSDPAVGKASEALQSRKAEKQIGRAGNEDRRPERYPVRGVKEGNSDFLVGLPR